MPKYEIRVMGTRLIGIEAIVTVEAASVEEAEELALVKAQYGDVDFIEETSGKGSDEWDMTELVDELL